MGSIVKSLSLMQLAMARASHLAFAIQGDPYPWITREKIARDN